MNKVWVKWGSTDTLLQSVLLQKFTDYERCRLYRRSIYTATSMFNPTCSLEFQVFWNRPSVFAFDDGIFNTINFWHCLSYCEHVKYHEDKTEVQQNQKGCLQAIQEYILL